MFKNGNNDVKNGEKWRSNGVKNGVFKAQMALKLLWSIHILTPFDFHFHTIWKLNGVSHGVFGGQMVCGGQMV